MASNRPSMELKMEPAALCPPVPATSVSDALDAAVLGQKQLLMWITDTLSDLNIRLHRVEQVPASASTRVGSMAPTASEWETTIAPGSAPRSLNLTSNDPLRSLSPEAEQDASVAETAAEAPLADDKLESHASHRRSIIMTESLAEVKGEEALSQNRGGITSISEDCMAQLNERFDQFQQSHMRRINDVVAAAVDEAFRGPQIEQALEKHCAESLRNLSAELDSKVRQTVREIQPLSPARASVRRSVRPSIAVDSSPTSPAPAEEKKDDVNEVQTSQGGAAAPAEVPQITMDAIDALADSMEDLRQFVNGLQDEIEERALRSEVPDISPLKQAAEEQCQQSLALQSALRDLKVDLGEKEGAQNELKDKILSFQFQLQEVQDIQAKAQSVSDSAQGGGAENDAGINRNYLSGKPQEKPGASNADIKALRDELKGDIAALKEQLSRLINATNENEKSNSEDLDWLHDKFQKVEDDFRVTESRVSLHIGTKGQRKSVLEEVPEKKSAAEEAEFIRNLVKIELEKYREDFWTEQRSQANSRRGDRDRRESRRFGSSQTTHLSPSSPRQPTLSREPTVSPTPPDASPRNLSPRNPEIGGSLSPPDSPRGQEPSIGRDALSDLEMITEVDYRISAMQEQITQNAMSFITLRGNYDIMEKRIRILDERNEKLSTELEYMQDYSLKMGTRVDQVTNEVVAGPSGHSRFSSRVGSLAGFHGLSGLPGAEDLNGRRDSRCDSWSPDMIGEEQAGQRKSSKEAEIKRKDSSNKGLESSTGMGPKRMSLRDKAAKASKGRGPARRQSSGHATPGAAGDRNCLSLPTTVEEEDRPNSAVSTLSAVSAKSVPASMSDITTDAPSLTSAADRVRESVSSGAVTVSQFGRLAKKIADVECDYKRGLDNAVDELGILGAKLQALVQFLNPTYRRLVEKTFQDCTGGSGKGTAWYKDSKRGGTRELSRGGSDLPVESKGSDTARRVSWSENENEVREFSMDSGKNSPSSPRGAPAAPSLPPLDPKQLFTGNPGKGDGSESRLRRSMALDMSVDSSGALRFSPIERSIAKRLDFLEDERKENETELRQMIEELQAENRSGSKLAPPGTPQPGQGQGPSGFGMGNKEMYNLKGKMEKYVEPKVELHDKQIDKVMSDVKECSQMIRRLQETTSKKCDRLELEPVLMRLSQWGDIQPKTLEADLAKVQEAEHQTRIFTEKVSQHVQKVESTMCTKDEMHIIKLEVVGLKKTLDHFKADVKETNTNIYLNGRQLTHTKEDLTRYMDEVTQELKANKAEKRDVEKLEQEVKKVAYSNRDNRGLLDATGGVEVSDAIRRIILNMEDKIMLIERRVESIAEGTPTKWGESHAGGDTAPSRQAAGLPPGGQGIAPGKVAAMQADIASTKETVAQLQKEVEEKHTEFKKLLEEEKSQWDMVDELKATINAPGGASEERQQQVTATTVQVLVAAAVNRVAKDERFVTRHYLDNTASELKREMLSTQQKVKQEGEILVQVGSQMQGLEARLDKLAGNRNSARAGSNLTRNSTQDTFLGLDGRASLSPKLLGKNMVVSPLSSIDGMGFDLTPTNSIAAVELGKMVTRGIDNTSAKKMGAILPTVGTEAPGKPGTAERSGSKAAGNAGLSALRSVRKNYI